MTTLSWHVQSYPGRHGMGPAHPEHEIGVALHSLQVGQTVQVKGPFGSFRYQPGKYKAIGESCIFSSCKALHVMPLSAHWDSLPKHIRYGRKRAFAHATRSAYADASTCCWAKSRWLGPWYENSCVARVASTLLVRSKLC